MKSVTDSGGFDSPRSSHTGSPKTPVEKERRRRGGGVKERRAQKTARERGTKASVEWSGLAAAAAAAAAAVRGFLKFTHGPPLHFFSSFPPLYSFLPPKAFFFASLVLECLTLAF